jgi:hypothetical protein
VNLRAETHRSTARVPVIGNLVLPRTDSPSLCSCPASGSASSFLPASALLCRHEILRSPDEQDARCVRSTSATRTTMRAPAPRAFPARYRDFRRVGAPQSLGSARLDRGTERFTTPETASADRQSDTNLESRLPARSERGRDSSHGARCDRASDIPVASPSCRPLGTPSRALRAWREPPRLPSPPPRERRWLVQPGMPSIDKDPS